MAVLEEDRTLAATSVPPSLATEIAKVMTEAANNAVEDVPAEIEALGASPTQARAVAQAVRLYLLREPGYRERARRVLLEGGFINGNIDLMLSKIEAGTAR